MLLIAACKKLLVTRKTGTVFGVLDSYDTDNMGRAFWRNAHSTVAQCPEEGLPISLGAQALSSHRMKNEIERP
ncbi:hypothetical protein ACC771_01550, partial [Rhizobium ruizarguesonis]